MERTLIYKRPGKFNKPEFFIALDELHIIKSKETTKAYACGSWDGYKNYVDGWIAKSLCQVINGKIYAPTWAIDRWTDLTHRICKDYYNKEFDVRDFPTLGVLSNIPSTDPDNDWEDEWPDADEEIHDDIYWKNKFAEEERKQEEKAYMAKMEWEMRNFA